MEITPQDIKNLEGKLLSLKIEGVNLKEIIKGSNAAKSSILY